MWFWVYPKIKDQVHFKQSPKDQPYLNIQRDPWFMVLKDTKKFKRTSIVESHSSHLVSSTSHLERLPKQCSTLGAMEWKCLTCSADCQWCSSGSGKKNYLGSQPIRSRIANKHESNDWMVNSQLCCNALYYNRNSSIPNHLRHELFLTKLRIWPFSILSYQTVWPWKYEIFSLSSCPEMHYDRCLTNLYFHQEWRIQHYVLLGRSCQSHTLNTVMYTRELSEVICVSLFCLAPCTLWAWNIY